MHNDLAIHRDTSIFFKGGRFSKKERWLLRHGEELTYIDRIGPIWKRLCLAKNWLPKMDPYNSAGKIWPSTDPYSAVSFWKLFCSY